MLCVLAALIVASAGVPSSSAQVTSAPVDATRVDASFGGGFGIHDLSAFDDDALDVAVQPDGGVVVVGRTDADRFDFSPLGDLLIARFTPAGRLDARFGEGGKLVLGSPSNYDEASAVAVQPDGKIVVLASLDGSLKIMRLTETGKPDPAFQGGAVTIPEARYQSRRGLLLEPDGRIVFSSGAVVLGRLKPDGTRDPGFGSNGLVFHTAGAAVGAGPIGRQPDGHLVVVGTAGGGSSSGPSEQAVVARYTPTGGRDTAFGRDGTAWTTFDTEYMDRGVLVEDVAVQPDGKIVVAGTVDVWNVLNRAPVTGGAPSRPPVRRMGLSDVALIRYLPDGRLDPDFAGSGKVITRVPGQPAPGFHRADGTTTTVETPSRGFAVALGTDGAIFVAGRSLQPYEQALLLRYTNGGLLDTTFGREGVFSVNMGEPRGWLNALAVAPDGALVVAGSSRIGWNEPPRYQNLLVGRVLPGTGEGTVWTWGWNALGQLGHGNVTDGHTPAKVSGLSGVVAVSAGAYHTLALRGDGTIWAWGSNVTGQLGDGTTVDRHRPVRVPGLSGVVAVSAGGLHSLALTGDGSLWAWGYNAFGQLGDGTTSTRLSPVKVKGLAHVTSVSAGLYHTLALREEGSAWAWGLNLVGQLGDGTVQDRLLPVMLPLHLGDYGYYRLSAGALHSLGVGVLDQVTAWGWNELAQLGTRYWSPPLSSPHNTSRAKVVASAGWYHSLSLSWDGRVYGAGWNALGQLGTGDTPLGHAGWHAVVGLTDASAVSAGGVHSLAVTRTREIRSWGWNVVGQLGTGTTADARAPVAVPGLTNATAVSAGYLHSVAIRA